MHLRQTASTDYTTPCPCVWVNAASGPFGGEGGLRTPSQILASRVYNMPTVSTISSRVYLGHTVFTHYRTPCVCAQVNAASGPFGGEGGHRPRSQILALCVYNMPTLSRISRVYLV